MKKLILIACLSSFLGGCAILSPWKAPTSCSDMAGNGAACASVESNLEYSLNKDGAQGGGEDEQLPEPYELKVPEYENDQFVSQKEQPKKKAAVVRETATPAYDETAVIKDELSRLFIEMAIDSSVTKKPTFIPPVTYRMLIYPYSSGAKYYSSRYVYITAGKPRWVTGSIVTDGMKHIKTEVPAPKIKRAEAVQNITFSRPPVKQPAQPQEVKSRHRVSAHLLNCRDAASTDGNSIAVFEQGQILEITDKSLSWWKVSYFNQECYVNSSYLYSEQEP